ncbi:MAG: hypothetical protein ACRCYY_05905 [Trueperaceae bacterium]
MLKPREMALELLEYKMSDLQNQRHISGGIASAWELYDYLCVEMNLLGGEQRKRLEDIGRTLRYISETPGQTKVLADTFEALVIESFPEITLTDETTPPTLQMFPAQLLPAGVPEVPRASLEQLSLEQQDEQRILQDLAREVWHQDLTLVLQQLAVQYRVEKDRMTARLIYTLVRNLEHYANTPSFVKDTQLTNFQITQSVPEVQDPLVSFNSAETITAILQEFVELVFSLAHEGQHKDLQLPRGQVLEYLKRLGLAVTRDPYAGYFSLLAKKGVNSQQIRAALEQLAKAPLRPDERQQKRQELEAKLNLAIANERKQREFFMKETQAFAVLIEDFFTKITPHLPKRVGGKASDPQLSGGVLFATTPALNITVVPKEAKAVTVCVRGPVRFTLSGIDVGVMGVQGAFSLYVGGKEYRLEPRQSIDLGKQKLFACYQEHYLHLKLHDEVRSLAAVVAEALAVLEVLRSPQRDALLRTLKAATNATAGEAQELVAQALLRFRELSSSAPNRKGVVSGLLQGAVKAEGLSLPDTVLNPVVQRVVTALTVTPQDLQRVLDNADKTFSSLYKLRDEPVTLAIAGQFLSLRLYKGKTEDEPQSVVVLQPGRVLGTFSSYLLAPFLNGTLLCVRSGPEVAVLYFDKVPMVATPR